MRLVTSLILDSSASRSRSHGAMMGLSGGVLMGAGYARTYDSSSRFSHSWYKVIYIYLHFIYHHECWIQNAMAASQLP